MLSLYPFLIASPALFCFQGVFPLWLLMAIIHRIYAFFKGYPVKFIIWLAYLPAISSISYIFNYKQSKIGHVIAYIVLFLVVIPSFAFYFDKRSKSLGQAILGLESFFLIVCLTLSLTSILDFILLVNNFDYSEYLPSHVNNIPIMQGLASRVRAFWAEPTDLGMATNSFFAFYLGIYSYTSKKRKVSKPFRFILIYFSWFLILVLTRSAGAFMALILSLFLLFIVRILRNKINFNFKIKPLLYFISSITIFLFIVYINRQFTEQLDVLLIKLRLDPSNASVEQRIGGSLAAFSYFFNDMNLIQWFIGAGPGNNSLISELDMAQPSLSWIISVLCDLGIFGFMSLGYIVYKLSVLTKTMPSEIQPYYFISISTLLIHLLTMTGFYLPVLPVIFSLPILFKYLDKSSMKNIKLT